MGEHRLPKGRHLIKGLINLGTALGYHVEREFPVISGSSGPSPAVDVAWFFHDGDPFPLMIFEVESGAGNTIAANPLKVFAQDSTRFEKPLFYFQVIITEGSKSSRIELLERQYGTHNYRLYRYGREEGTQLVADILRQHRRIRDTVSYVALYEVLAQEEWNGFVDEIAVLQEAFALALSPNQRLADLLHLGRNHPSVRFHVADAIHLEQRENWPTVQNSPSWLAIHWGPPMLCAWMIGDDEASASNWDQHLLTWQETYVGYMPMFTSEIGLSQEYTEFILSLGGPFVACLLGVARCRGTTCRQFVAVLLEVLNKIGVGDFGLQLAIWLCHICARLEFESGFERAQTYIGNAGGLQLQDVLSPPSSFSLEGEGRDEYFQPGASTPLSMHEFAAKAQQSYRGVECDRAWIAFGALTDDEFCLEWARPVLVSVWSDV